MRRKPSRFWEPECLRKGWHELGRAMLRMRAIALTVVAVASTVAPVAAQPVHRAAVPELTLSLEGAGAPVVGRVRFASFREDGGLVVADDSESRLHLFNPDGRFIRSAGGPGAGPGEFRSIEWVGSCSAGEVAAFDPVQGRVSYFDASGNYLRQRVVPGVQAVYGCRPDGSVVVLMAEASIQGTMRGSLKYISNSGASGEIATGLLVMQPVLLGAELHVAVGRDALAFGVSDSAAISVIVPVRASPKRVFAGLSGRKPSSTHRIAAIEKLARGFLGTSEDYDRMRAIYGRMPTSSSLPAYSGLFVDNATGKLWVNRSPAGSTETMMERRSYSGELESLVELPRGLRPFAVYNDRLVGVKEDSSSGVQQLLVFKLAR